VKTMWSVLAVVAITILWWSQCSARAISPTGRTATPSDLLVQRNTEFAFALYTQIAREDGNIAVSPLSVSVATAMLYAGARGRTEKEIASVARFELPKETLHREFAILLDELNTRVAPWAKLSFANGVWIDDLCRALPDYTALLSDFYGATLESVDFGESSRDACTRINGFISERTQGKIQSIVAPEMFTALTTMVLVNTVYFLAAWDHKFLEADTNQEPFHLLDSSTVSVDMMHRTRTVPYYEDASVQVLEIPYQGSGLSMLLVLPAPHVGLVGLEAQITPSLLSVWVKALVPTDVQMAIPRFEVTRRIDLIPPLMSMGMKDVFDERSANLRGMCDIPRLYAQYAIHHVTLGISEKGTEAAAATVYVATQGEEGEGFQKRIVTSFRADRPFIYIIRDMRCGTILFLGRVVDPET